MNLNEIRSIAHKILEDRKIESDCIEYKKSANQKDKILKAICAFSNNYMNRDCGFIFIGIEEIDDKETGDKAIPLRPISGIEEAQIESIENNLKQLLPYIHPRPICHFISDSIDEKFYIVIVVEPSSNITEVTEKGANKFGLPKGGRYIRVSRDCVLPNTKQELELLRKFSDYSFVSEFHPTATLDDLNYEYMKEYLVRTGAKEDMRRLTKEEMAKELKLIGNTLITKDRVKNLAILMFADKPNDYISNAHVEIIREIGGDTSRMEAKKFEGPIWIQALQVSNYFKDEIQRSLTLRFDEKIEHDIIFNWPLTAFEEIATNCILHKQYEVHEYVGIYVYNDRLEFINHNQPLPPVTIRDMNEKSSFTERQYINPELKDMFFALDLIESYGSGIRRAKEALEKNKSPKMKFLPENNEYDYTKVIIPIQNEFLKNKYIGNADMSKIFEGLDQLSLDIILLMQNLPSITQAEICKTIKKPRATVQRRIKKLVESGIVERIGSARKGNWIIRKKDTI